MQTEIINSEQLAAELEKSKLELSLFSSIEWLQLFDSRLKIIAIFSDDRQLIGYWYGLMGKKLKFSYFINTPFTPHCGLVYLNKSSNAANFNTFNKKIMKTMAGFFKEKKISLVHLALPHTTIDTQAFIWNKFLVTAKYTYHLQLHKSEAELFDELSSEKRKSIRKAISDEISIRLVTDYKLIIDLLKNTFIKNKVKHEAELIEKILFQFANANNSFAFAAYDKNEKLIASNFCLFDHNTCYYLFGGFDAEHKHHGAGVHCMWSSILQAKKLNLSVFDFEGSMLKDVEKYFREFGGTLIPYYEIKYKDKVLKLVS